VLFHGWKFSRVVYLQASHEALSDSSHNTRHTGPCCCMYAGGGILLNQKRLCVDLVHEDEWNSMRCFAFYGTGNPCAGFAERTLAKRFHKNLRRMRPCHGSSKLRSRNAQPKPPPRRCWVPRDWVFRWWVVHPHPRCPLPVSRNLTIPRPISASFLAKRKWPTSVSPRSISSIGKTLAAACS
jgi:hypothetical protein